MSLVRTAARVATSASGTAALVSGTTRGRDARRVGDRHVTAARDAHAHSIISKPFDNRPKSLDVLPPGRWSCNYNYSYQITCACLRLLKCVLRDHNSNNCTHSGNVYCCTYIVNND